VVLVVVLNQAGATEPRSMLHRQGRRYKRQKSLTKHLMTLATRGWLLIYCSPPIHFHNKILAKRKSISTERETNPNILINWEGYILL
jgi:hypothetical protein